MAKKERDRQTEELIERPTGRVKTDRPIKGLTYRETGIQRDKHTSRQRDRQTNREPDRQTYREIQIHRQTSGQSGRQRDRHTERQVNKPTDK